MSQKVALITGASSGIGAAIAQRFDAEGYRVFSAQRRPAAVGESLEADLLQAGAAQAVADQVKAQAGRLDALVNNAGLMREGTVEETSDADWAAQIQLNLTLPFELIRACLPLLHAAQGAGSIVNIGSIEGLGSNPRHPAYCASKAGLHGLTRAVAVDEGPRGVRCNAVAPGWIDTPLNLDFIDSLSGDKEAFRADLARIHPAGRTGTPEEVASLVFWLASDQARFMTGQVLTLDGGRTVKLSLP